MRMEKIVLVVFLLAAGRMLTSPTAFAANYYVQQGAGSDSNPGDNWGKGHALKSVSRALQLAAATADTDFIHIAQGTYPEHLQMPDAGDKVSLLGGYPPGGGKTPDPSVHPTIIDAQRSGRPLRIESRSNITVDGLILLNGRTGGIGGGIFIGSSSAITVRNCIVKNNTSTGDWGGGIGVYASNVTLESNRIFNNSTPHAGGGVSLYGGCTGTMRDNLVTGNETEGGGGGTIISESSIDMTGNTIRNNRTRGNGGGILIQRCRDLVISGNDISFNSGFDGGGIAYDRSTGCAILGNFISGNTSGNWGGGICLQYEASSDEITNNVIADNSADGNGGGISLYDRSSAAITNNTIVGNTAGGCDACGSGVYIPEGTEAIIRSTILWANANSQIDIYGDTAEVTYSDIAGGWEGEGNLDARPLFLSRGDYHLKTGSPCIDTGSASGAPATDIDGVTRPVGSRVDMGAYEWAPGPDLTGLWRSVSLAPGGGSMTAVFTLINVVKDQNAGPFRVSFYFSEDGKSLPKTPFKVLELTKGLEGGQRRLVEVKYSFPTPILPGFVVAVVDSERQVLEIRENNNKKSAPITND